MISRRRVALFALLAGCSLAAVATVVSGAREGGPAVSASAAAGKVLGTARAAGRPMIVFRNLDREPPRGAGQVALVALDEPGASRTLARLGCDRVYFAAGRGLCLVRGKDIEDDSRALVLGADLRVRHELEVEGVPSRARVSADGRYGSVTLFVKGHAYATAGSFSAQTTLIDLASGRKIADLEQFVVTRSGRRVTAVDVNFWGVTFARDSDQFYATLATGGKTYLIRGSVRARTAQVIHVNVECPSLSPDGTRIAYKRREPSWTRPWRLTVLDLSTMRETPLAETRSVDDQAEWLDDAHVLYGLDGDVWMVRTDGRGQPRRYLRGADSPAVVRR